MFAVIKTGGKQYKVEVGSVLKVEKLAAEINSDVVLDEVLMIDGKVGTPFVEGAKVIATVKAHDKLKKAVSYTHLTLPTTERV